jgi:hypothetical protein
MTISRTDPFSTPALTYINSQASWSSQRTVEWDLPPGKKREAYYLSANVSLAKPANGLVAFTEQMRASCHLEVLGDALESEQKSQSVA